MSGSGDLDTATVKNDVSFTTYSPPAVPRSGVAKKRSTLFSICVVIVHLSVIPLVCPMLYC